MASAEVATQEFPRGLRRSVHATSAWLKGIAERLGGNKQRAYHALRGVLFAIRDRIPADEAMDLSAQLPALVRGVFFEGYRVSGKPETYRGREEFLERVNAELDAVGGGNPEEATRAVLSFLNEKVSAGEIDDIRHILPSAVRDLWPEG